MHILSDHRWEADKYTISEFGVECGACIMPL